MEIGIALKIQEDKKLHDYLIHHSFWYTLLNRDSKNYDLLVKEYKSYVRNKNLEKVEDAIDNAELISNVLKVM